MIGAQPRLILRGDQHRARALGDGVVPLIRHGNAPVADLHVLDDVGGKTAAIRLDSPPKALAQQIVGDHARHRDAADLQVVEARQRAGFTQRGIDVDVAADRTARQLDGPLRHAAPGRRTTRTAPCPMRLAA